MAERTLVVSATNLMARGYHVVPVDRRAPDGTVVNGLFAVARALEKLLAQKPPTRAVAVVAAGAPPESWPPLLRVQAARLPALCRTLGLAVVEAENELGLCASYAVAAASAGDDVTVAGVDKRYAQLVADRVWWFDANKDVRYTPEVVQKRFNVAPDRVADWLALVGDEDQVPGVKGIGAKGATELLTQFPSVSAALHSLASLEGRIAKALSAEGEGLIAKLRQAQLPTDLALPQPLNALGWEPPTPESRNFLYEQWGFSELLHATSTPQSVEVVDSAEVLQQWLGAAAAPVTFHALLDEQDPWQQQLVGFGLADAGRRAVYVPVTAGTRPVLERWLATSEQPKRAHDVVATWVAVRRGGAELAGLLEDSACLSHLCEPSGWAPHDLTTVAKHVLGRALEDDEAVLGTGRSQKRFAELSVERAAGVAVQRALASLEICEQLRARVDSALLGEYLTLTELLVRMELTGLAVDVSKLDAAETAFAEIEAELETQITALAGHSFNINSSKQLGSVLFEELKLPVVSHTKTGWSTSNEALERIADAHPIVSLVVRWRGLRRLRDSWLNSLRKTIASDGRVHSRFHPARSFSGHIINSNPDLGRVPGRTPEMARVRRAFVAPPGRVLMSVDFNQLGLYVLAHLTKDPALVEPLRTRSDMHRLTAGAILEKAPASISLEERQIGKVVNFATFAGQGASSLGLQLGLTPAEAKAYIQRFDRHYAKVRAFQDEQERLARERGFITTIAGRRWPIGGFESLDSALQSYAVRLSRRATHEASVSDVSRRALVLADRALRARGLKTVPLLQILDEVLFEVPTDELNSAAQLCAEAMRHAFELEVPLVVGVEVGPNWADLEPVPLTA